MDNAPHAAVDYILKNREEYAKAKARRVFLEEFRKSKKAMLMKQALQMGYEAVNAQEREAYRNAEYIAVLEGLQVAIEVEETLKWGLEAARMRVDVWRTEEATNRMVDRSTQ